VKHRGLRRRTELRRDPGELAVRLDRGKRAAPVTGMIEQLQYRISS
jgi:hypothetical protein